MKSTKNILIAFILNLSFSIIEFVGGSITNSVAILSDAIHDIGDSLSIGLAYFLEKKSNGKPDDKYTYGYARYSVIGSTITTIILIISSFLIIYSAIKRIINPVKINYNGMIILSILGIIINFLASQHTKEGHSLNQKTVNLHMLEDILGWIIVFIGAVTMRFTNIVIIDPILSILVALFILTKAIKNLKIILDIYLEKIPSSLSIEEIKNKLYNIKGIVDIHHIHIWSIDGYNNYATMHIVSDGKNKKLKEEVKEELKDYNINHTTIELENKNENCNETYCEVSCNSNSHK